MTDDLKRQHEELSFLCLNYDPCASHPKKEICYLLEKYHLTHIEDPFMVTNELLKMLDQCEAQIKREKGFFQNVSDQLH